MGKGDPGTKGRALRKALSFGGASSLQDGTGEQKEVTEQGRTAGCVCLQRTDRRADVDRGTQEPGMAEALSVQSQAPTGSSDRVLSLGTDVDLQGPQMTSPRG